MNNIPDVKIGVIAGTTDWLPTDIAVENRRRMLEEYRNSFGDENIYECSIIISDNEVSIKRAFREVSKAECNAVVLYWANYGPESAGTLFAQEFSGPIMMIAAAEERGESDFRDRRDALSGFINACYALKLRGTNVYIPGRPWGTYIQCAEMIQKFRSIARTVLALEDLKLISIGPRPSSYLAANAPNYLLYDIGIEVSEYSELEIFDSFQKHEGDKRIEKTVEMMKKELAVIKTPDVLPILAQYELTLEDWIRNHKGNKKYVTITSTCWPAFPVNFGFVPCYVNSRLTAKGYPVACEVDEYGAVSEYIGQCVSNDMVTILNINNNISIDLYEEKIKGRDFNGVQYEQGDLFLGYHCGVTPNDKLQKSTLEYHFVNHQLIGEGQSKGTIQGNVISGAVTVFRLQGMRDNKLRAYVCQGQILPVEVETYGGKAIIAIRGMQRFIRNVILENQYPNHCIVVFGHYGEQIVEILHQFGIYEIEYNHPSGIPYRHENMYCELPGDHFDWQY